LDGETRSICLYQISLHTGIMCSYKIVNGQHGWTILHVINRAVQLNGI